MARHTHQVGTRGRNALLDAFYAGSTFVTIGKDGGLDDPNNHRSRRGVYDLDCGARDGILNWTEDPKRVTCDDCLAMQEEPTHG